MAKNIKYYQGRYTPINPKKYRGDVRNIQYRSSWEKKMMLRLDKDSNVIEWSSEEIIVPYRSPLDGQIHRYFVDFFVKSIKSGKVMSYLIEVKPYRQTIEPVKKSRISKTYINEVVTYVVNVAKWKAAEKYCADRGWEFFKITEKDLKLL
jgi:hypothetical protein